MLSSLHVLVFALIFCPFSSAVPALVPRAVTTITSKRVTTTTLTKLTPVTSCSCTSKSTSAKHTSTITYTVSASCSSKKIAATCKTTTSTAKSTIVSTITSRITSTIPPISTKPTTSSKLSSKSLIPTTTSKPAISSTTLSSATATPTKNNGKRGLAYNDPNLTQPFSLFGQGSKVSWAYNWYSYPYTIGQTQTGYNPALEFVPMLWSTASDLTSVWESNVRASMAKYGTTSVVAFNEPDGCGGGGSCMNLSSAISGYQTWINPLAGTVRLGAPAVTNGGGSMGLTYLQSFIAGCTRCQIDFVPVHWYGDAGNSSGFEWYIGQAYAAAGNRPLWVTEFGTTSGTTEQTQNFLQNVMQFMDGSSMVEKYSWFMDAAGNLINANGTGMSPLGSMYNSG